MKHIQNDYMRIQLQNALMAQEVAEAAKLRQAEKARTRAADAVGDLHDQAEEPKVKKIAEKGEDGPKGKKDRPQSFPKFRYHPDGTLEESKDNGESSGPASTNRIDIKA